MYLFSGLQLNVARLPGYRDSKNGKRKGNHIFERYFSFFMYSVFFMYKFENELITTIINDTINNNNNCNNNDSNNFNNNSSSVNDNNNNNKHNHNNNKFFAANSQGLSP